jgi:ATP-binding cassette subfamily F protein uup
MDKIVDHLFVFQGDGVIDDFPGNYSDYRSYESNKPEDTPIIDSSKEKKQWKKDDNNKLSYNEQKEFKNIESKLSTLEYDKKELEKQFHNTSLEPNDIVALSEKLQLILDEIETKEMRWLELMAKLEETNNL